MLSRNQISDDGKQRAQSSNFEVAVTSWFIFSKIKLVAQIVKEFLPTLPKHWVGTTWIWDLIWYLKHLWLLLKHLANTNFIKRSFLAIILSRRFPNLKNRLFFVGFTNAVDLDVWSTSNSKSVKHVLDSHIFFGLVNLQNYFIQRKRTLHTLSW